MRRGLCGAIVVAALCAGCSRSYPPQRFRVVDAVSGSPLQGVAVTRRSTSNEIFERARSEERAYPPTDAGGVVVADDPLDRSMKHSFRFSKTDYQGAVMTLSGGKFFLVSPIEGRTAGLFVPLAREVTVPMHPTPRGNLSKEGRDEKEERGQGSN